MRDFFYGKSADFTAGTTPTLYTGNKGWSVDPSAEDLRTDNTADNGYSNRIAGIRNCGWTIEMDWDASKNPLDDPPGLSAGNTITGLKLWLDQIATSPFYLFALAIVLHVPVNNMIGTVCHLSASGANKGAYLRPGGNFTPSAAAANY